MSYTWEKNPFENCVLISFGFISYVFCSDKVFTIACEWNYYESFQN